MTTLELKAKEQELLQEIALPPCQYSIEELKERLEKGRIAAKNGVYKTQSEMRRKHAL